MAQPNWHLKHWNTGKPMTLTEAFGFGSFKLKFPPLQAQLPKHVGRAQASGGSQSSGGGGIQQKFTGPGMKNFATSVLKGIGAPVTGANIRSIEAWAQREGGGGTNNPLNTTQPMPGSTTFNSVGVQNYSSANQGANATIITLENGLYGDILGALKTGKGLCGKSLAGLSKWSGGGYNAVC